jgi:hypoxanthine phosphoribosyltransferase
MADDRSVVVDDITDAGSTLVRFPENKRLVWVRRHASRARAAAALYLPEGDGRWVLFPWEREADAAKDESEYERK